MTAKQMGDSLHSRSDEGKLLAWLGELGLRFDPFGPLDASADPRLSDYLVGHHVFARVWGDRVSWVCAPPGGGKTALRVRTARACWIGQETNHPFPITYDLPFLSWGHASPSLEDHLAALARAGAVDLLLALAHRPHWFFQLGQEARRSVRDVLEWSLPGPLPLYLDLCSQPDGLELLRERLDETFVLPDSPDSALLLRWCDELITQPASGARPSAAVRWGDLRRLLLEDFEFPSLYILVDGLDAAPETVSDAEAAAACLAPMMPRVAIWAGEQVFVKGFLPADTRAVLSSRFPSVFEDHNVAEVDWDTPLLAEVIRRRVFVASEGAFGSLDAIASPGLRDVETTLARNVLPLPREMLVLTHRLLQEHVERQNSGKRIEEDDLERAKEWYKHHKPALGFGDSPREADQ